MNPSTPEQWIAVAKERGADAKTINQNLPHSVGAIYLAGYAIECSLKAFLQKQSTGFPKHRSEGHNLRALWKASKFRLSDLNDYNGCKAFFIQTWKTDLRYQTELDSALPEEELIKGAKELVGWIQKQIRPPRKR